MHSICDRLERARARAGCIAHAQSKARGKLRNEELQWEPYWPRPRPVPVEANSQSQLGMLYRQVQYNKDRLQSSYCANLKNSKH